MQETSIYFISKNDIRTKDLVKNYIYPNKELNYYWSNDFSCDFYIELAHFGFISISSPNENETILLSEMQFEYSVLDFSNLHISQKVQKLLNKNTYTFKINHDYKKVIEILETYHKDSWCTKEYKKLLYELITYKHKSIDFSLNCFEVYEDEMLMACEIGYTIGKTYTSLSGYSNRAYNNYGTLQLVLLGKYLNDNSYHFWNLGHALMAYKEKLGAIIYSREDFLKRWTKSI